MAEDMFTMRQDALRRAREMHSRAAPMPDQRRDQPKQGSNNRQEHRQDPPVHKEEPQKEEKQEEKKEHKPDLLEALFKDKDRTIILALLILLSGENGDNTLLFALMYLLM